MAIKPFIYTFFFFDGFVLRVNGFAVFECNFFGFEGGHDGMEYGKVGHGSS